MRTIFLFLFGVLLLFSYAAGGAEHLPVWPGIHVNFRSHEPIKLEYDVKKMVSLQDFADIRVDSPLTVPVTLSSSFNSFVTFHATIPKNWNGTDSIPLVYEMSSSDEKCAVLFYISRFEITFDDFNKIPSGYVKQRESLCEEGHPLCFYFPPDEKKFKDLSSFFLPAGVDSVGHPIYKPYGMLPPPWDIIFSNHTDHLFTFPALGINFYKAWTMVNYGNRTHYQAPVSQHIFSNTDFFPPEKSKIRIAFDPNRSLEIHSDSPCVFNLSDYDIVSVTGKIEENKAINKDGLKGVIPAHWNGTDSIMMTLTVHDNPGSSQTKHTIQTLEHPDIFIIPIFSLNYTIIRTQPLLDGMATKVTYGRGIVDVPLVFSLSKKQTRPVHFSIQPAFGCKFGHNERILGSFPYPVVIPENTDSATVMLKVNTDSPFSRTGSDLWVNFIYNAESPGDYAMRNAVCRIEVKMPPEMCIDSQIVMRFQKDSDSPVRIKFGESFRIPVLFRSADSSLADSDIFKNREQAYTLAFSVPNSGKYNVQCSNSSSRMRLSKGDENIHLKIRDPNCIALISAHHSLLKDEEITVKLKSYTDENNILSPLVGEPYELKFILEKNTYANYNQRPIILNNSCENSSAEYDATIRSQFSTKHWTDSSSRHVYNWYSPDIKVDVRSLFSEEFPSSVNTLIGDSENTLRLTLSADCRDSRFIIRNFNMKFIKPTSYIRYGHEFSDSGGVEIDHVYYLSHMKAESEQLDSGIKTSYVKDGTAYVRWDFKVKVTFSAKFHLFAESSPYDLKYQLTVNCTVDNESDVPMNPESYRVSWMESDDLVVFMRQTDSKLNDPPLGIMRRDGCRLSDPENLYQVSLLGGGFFSVSLNTSAENPAGIQQKKNQPANRCGLFSIRDGQLTDFLYHEINPLHDGLFQVRDSFLNVGYISTRGKVIIAPDSIYGTHSCFPPYGAGLVGYYKIEKKKMYISFVPGGYTLKKRSA